MTIRDRMLALRQHVQSIEHGAHVWAFERFETPADIKPVDADDCTLVYEDGDLLGLFPDIEQTLCEKSPSGQCEFDDLSGDEHDCCIYCGGRTG